MLVRKKMSAKKLAIYLAVIFFMIGGGGLMILQGRKLTSVQPVITNLPPINSAGTAPAAAPLSNFPVSPEITGANNQTAALAAPTANNSRSVGSLNLSIFSSDKFKNLLANILIAREAAEAGKTDPFKPN